MTNFMLRLLKSAKGAVARRQGEKELDSPFGGAPDTAAVLREFPKSAKGAAARRQGKKELDSPFGGAPDTAAVLGEFLRTPPEETSEKRDGSDYASLSWHDSAAIRGVRFALRRISLGQRMELTKRIIELTARHEFLKAGDPADQLEAALADMLVSKLYLEWGLDRVEGLIIDGQPATVELLIERGPDDLASEIIAVLRKEAGLSEEERKN